MRLVEDGLAGVLLCGGYMVVVVVVVMVKMRIEMVIVLILVLPVLRPAST